MGGNALHVNFCECSPTRTYGPPTFNRVQWSPLPHMRRIYTSRKRKLDHRIKGVENTNLLEWVLQQKQGKFAVEFDGHCISWNTENNYILETDPSYEAPPLSKTRLRTAATLVDAGSELGFDIRRRCLVLLYSQVRYSR